MFSDGQIDQIITGISFGMPLEHMFVLMELSPEEMEAFRKDDSLMSRANAASKKCTYDLLKDLHTVISIQKDKGKDHALTWLLERTDSHFMPGNDGGDKPGVINIITHETNIESSDTVSVNTYSDKKLETDSEEATNLEEPR